MTATAERIGFITEEYRIVTSGPDNDVLLKYGSLARRATEPAATYLDSVLDAQALCDERHNLLKQDRRRFQQTVSGEDFGLGLEYSETTPTVTIIDSERDANFSAAIVEISVDLEAGTSSIVAWG